MFKILKNKKGFTLIELMIVVAILGILAAVAIPMYINYQNRARMAEAPVSIDAMKKGITSSLSRNLGVTGVFAGKNVNEYPILPIAPAAGTLGNTTLTWAGGEMNGYAAATNWSPLGSATFARYAVAAAVGAGAIAAPLAGCTIGAETDTDADTNAHFFALSIGVAAYVGEPVTLSAGATGTPATQNTLLETGGAF